MSWTVSMGSEDHARMFSRLGQEILELHHQRRYGDALAVADRAVKQFPEFSARTTFFRACLLCCLGLADEALRALGLGLENGEWWAAWILRSDPDLAPLWGRVEFARLVDRSADMEAAANERSAPTLRVVEPEASGGALPVLIALHGSGGLPQPGEWWERVSEAGWLVALPRSSRLLMPGAPAWMSLALARTELRAHHEALVASYPVDRDRTVLAGFSQGAGVALELGLDGELGATGAIAVAPGFPDVNRVLKQLSPARRSSHPRTYLFIGQGDEGLGTARSVHAALQAANVSCWLDERPGTGHAFPADAEDTIDRALAFVTAPS